MKGYYAFLARSVFYQREKQILDYHKNSMRDLGCSFSWIKLLKALFSEMGNLLFNPKETLERVTRRIMKVARVSGEQHGCE